jgi:hypothetical protein
MIWRKTSWRGTACDRKRWRLDGECVFESATTPLVGRGRLSLNDGPRQSQNVGKGKEHELPGNCAQRVSYGLSPAPNLTALVPWLACWAEVLGGLGASRRIAGRGKPRAANRCRGSLTGSHFEELSHPKRYRFCRFGLHAGRAVTAKHFVRHDFESRTRPWYDPTMLIERIVLLYVVVSYTFLSATRQTHLGDGLASGGTPSLMPCSGERFQGADHSLRPHQCHSPEAARGLARPLPRFRSRCHKRRRINFYICRRHFHSRWLPYPTTQGTYPTTQGKQPETIIHVPQPT